MHILSYISASLKWWYPIFSTFIINKRCCYMKLEEKLQLLRKQNGYSQEQLANKLGMDVIVKRITT